MGISTQYHSRVRQNAAQLLNYLKSLKHMQFFAYQHSHG